MRFMVINSLPQPSAEAENCGGGVGQRNLMKRLQLLYPGRHTLLCRVEENRTHPTERKELSDKVYRAELTLTLASS